MDDQHWSDAPSATIEIDAEPEAVFAVISDPSTYPEWLPGARRIRSIDPGWPAPGTAFHHVVGVGPVRVADRTEVLAIDPPRQFDLRARIGPFGSADVRFDLTEVEGPDGRPGTSIEVFERPQEGAVALAWRTLARVNIRIGLWGRNELAVRRLKEWCERSGDGGPAERDHPA